MLTAKDIAKMLDHSLLRPSLTPDEVRAGIELALKYDMASVCVQPRDVKMAADMVAGTDVDVGPVINFPHGNAPTQVKVYEAERALDDGAVELDMVLPIGHLLAGDDDYVAGDIRAVVEAAHARQAIVKVIFENGYLTDEQIVKACQICQKVGADFVKTSTGYGPGGATLEDVRLMRQSCPPEMSVKAAGGIRDLDTLLQYRAAGAARIGASSSEQIMVEAVEREKAGTLQEIEEGS